MRLPVDRHLVGAARVRESVQSRGAGVVRRSVGAAMKSRRRCDAGRACLLDGMQRASLEMRSSAPANANQIVPRTNIAASPPAAGCGMCTLTKTVVPISR